MREIKIYTYKNLHLKLDVPGARKWAIALEKAMMTYFELEQNTIFPEHSHEPAGRQAGQSR